MVVLTGHNIAIGSTIVDIEKEQGQAGTAKGHKRRLNVWCVHGTKMTSDRS